MHTHKILFNATAYLSVMALIAIVACTTDSESNELLELKSISECISNTEDLSGFDENSAILEQTDDMTLLKFPALWDGATETPKLRYSRSTDTLIVELYSGMNMGPGINCAVWVNASVHGDLDANFLRVNAQTFKLRP